MAGGGLFDHMVPAPVRWRTPVGRFVGGLHAGVHGHCGYRLYVPPGARGRARPLVLMLHGCRQDPVDFALGTRMNVWARRLGCYVLYPAQSPLAHRWRCWQWYLPRNQRRDSGEPALLAELSRTVMVQHRVDPRRVYVAGLSAGGAMAALLARLYPELYAAVGVHSGLAPGAACGGMDALIAMRDGHAGRGLPAATQSVPAIVFHGDADEVVHPRHGEHVLQAALAGTPVIRVQESAGSGQRRWTRWRLQGADGRTLAEHWVLHGAGHAWSGGDPRGSYADAHGPDAAREMLRFFLQHAAGRASWRTRLRRVGAWLSARWRVGGGWRAAARAVWSWWGVRQ